MTNVFSADGATPPAEGPAPTLNDLVGEGKKFKTADDLAKGKLEADNYIEQLKSENKGLRDKAEININAENQLKALKDELKSLREVSEQPKGPTDQALSERDIEALVERTITQTETRRTATQNINEANARVVRHFGTVEAAQTAIRTKAQELGMSVDALRDVAAKSPTAFLKVVDVTADAAPTGNGSFIQPSAGPTPTGVGTGNLKPGTYEYAEHIRRTNESLYWSPSFQMKHVWEPKKAGTYLIPG